MKTKVGTLLRGKEQRSLKELLLGEVETDNEFIIDVPFRGCVLEVRTWVDTEGWVVTGLFRSSWQRSTTYSF